MRSEAPHWPAARRAPRALAAWALAAVCAAPAAAQTVFACEPEWAALTRMLLPEARLLVATHARQDPHHIEARPALIAQLRSADLAVCTGAALEAGWLPLLQQRAGNPAVQDGAPGMFYAAQQVRLIDPHTGSITPFDGDVHPDGNPHLHADPQRLQAVAQALAQRLKQLYPAQAAAIGQRHATWDAAWRLRLADWQRQAEPLKGQTVVVQHAVFGYLWSWLGLRVAADLEPKPGMAPTPGHLQRTLQAVAAQPPLAIVVAGYQDPRPAQWLAEQLARAPANASANAPASAARPARAAAVPVLVLPATVPDEPTPEALARWVDQLLAALLNARQGQAR